MILTCPECATRYDTETAKFPAAGRKVRCAKCGHVWHQVGPQLEPDPELFGVVAHEAEQQPEPVPAIRAESVPPRRSAFAPEPGPGPGPEHSTAEKTKAAKTWESQWTRAGAMFGWVGLAGVILVICWSAVSYRQQIATVWPQSASLFARLGMAVNIRGIEFVDVRHANQREDGQPVLLITGMLKNVGMREIPVPPIRVTVSDAAAHILYGRNFMPKARELAAGETMPFRVRLSNPPAAARHVNLRLADPKK
jgi:predicted Zn finger-like uncharacterized protein